ncbi:YgaB family protein [Bacillus marinisedimentorum]|uniref:YgaB family protein n=1 Tax=Bacillus marinisedimentorum TaxID=1821260 RepID=UPI0008734CBA|nr:YgaB family protein [Bacillus marinisedimentorum]
MGDFSSNLALQMEIIDKLLCLQGEVESCSEEMKRLLCVKDDMRRAGRICESTEARLDTVCKDLENKKNELQRLQELFEKQTNLVISSF